MIRRFLWRQRARQVMVHIPEAPRFNSADAGQITSTKELYALQPGLLQVLDQEFQLESLAGRLCPVLMQDQSVALFALPEYVGSDQADELTRRIVQRGYCLTNPARYVLPAPLLLAIGRRQQLSPEDTPSVAVIEHTKTALADAFQELIAWGVRHKASDLHINLCMDEAVSQVRYTIAGHYVAPDCFQNMPTSMLHDMLAVVWMDIRGGNGAVFDPLSEQQGSVLRQVDGQALILRWASMAAERGPSVCLRLLVRASDVYVPGLEELGYFPDQIQQISRAMNAEGGAILFAGTVGSGKSTTLASLISGLPQHRKVITIEDPVEYLMPQAIQNTVVRALDTDAHDNYAAKLRALKRSAMSDVLLGEIRDRETGMAFMDLAGSGVNVYSTVHAPSAVLVAERLASDFISVSRDFLATPGLLKLLVYQALLPTLCIHCSLPVSSLLSVSGQMLPACPHLKQYGSWRRWLGTLSELYGDRVDGLKVRNPSGCSQCRQHQLAQLNGYVGRTVAAEILEPALCPGYLESLHARRLHTWIQKDQTTDANARAYGNTAMHSAMLKAFQGLIDPRDIEVRFQSFQTMLLRRRSSGDSTVSNLHLRVVL